MAASAVIYAGQAVIAGIQGTFLLQSGSNSIFGTGTASGNANFETIDLNDEFEVDRLKAANGSTVETIIAKCRKRTITGKFVPNGTSAANAKAGVTAYLALTPLTVITTSGFTQTELNGTWNYVGGAKLNFSREGYLIADIQLEANEVAGTAGTFAGLAVAS